MSAYLTVLYVRARCKVLVGAVMLMSQRRKDWLTGYIVWLLGNRLEAFRVSERVSRFVMGYQHVKLGYSLRQKVRNLWKSTHLNFWTLIRTSSSAVAERPRDASCLPVVSLVQYVERNVLLLVTLALDLPLRTLKFCSLTHTPHDGIGRACISSLGKKMTAYQNV